MQKKEDKKPEKKKYSKMILTKHKKLRDVTTSPASTIYLGCTKFLF